MRWCAAFLFFIVCSAARAQPGTSLAYDDDFVWYLAGRLASDLTAFQARLGIKLNEGEREAQEQQFEIGAATAPPELVKRRSAQPFQEHRPLRYEVRRGRDREACCRSLAETHY